MNKLFFWHKDFTTNRVKLLTPVLSVNMRFYIKSIYDITDRGGFTSNSLLSCGRLFSFAPFIPLIG